MSVLFHSGSDPSIVRSPAQITAVVPGDGDQSAGLGSMPAQSDTTAAWWAFAAGDAGDVVKSSDCSEYFAGSSPGFVCCAHASSARSGPSAHSAGALPNPSMPTDVIACHGVAVTCGTTAPSALSLSVCWRSAVPVAKSCLPVSATSSTQPSKKGGDVTPAERHLPAAALRRESFSLPTVTGSFGKPRM